MSKEEFYKKWDKQVEHSQSACNALPLLNCAKIMLQEWREVGGKWNGEDCAPYLFFIYQITYLAFGQEVEWREWGKEKSIIDARIAKEGS